MVRNGRREASPSQCGIRPLQPAQHASPSAFRGVSHGCARLAQKSHSASTSYAMRCWTRVVRSALLWRHSWAFSRRCRALCGKQFWRLSALSPSRRLEGRREVSRRGLRCSRRHQPRCLRSAQPAFERQCLQRAGRVATHERRRTRLRRRSFTTSLLADFAAPRLCVVV